MIHKNLLHNRYFVTTTVVICFLFTAILVSFLSASSHNLRAQNVAPLEPRLLEQYPLAPIIITIAGYMEWSLILTIVAMFTNSFGILFSIILYLQSFFFMGFATVEQGPLKQFYTELLGSKITLFAVLKLLFGIDTSQKDNGLPYNFRYAGVQMKLLHNIIPVFIVIGALFLVTIVTVILNLILKSQKIRKFIINLKSIWNGSIYCLMPNICFFMGAKGFFLNFQTMQNIIDAIVFMILGVLIFVYFGFTLVQIRRHVSHPSIKELKKTIAYISYLKTTLFKFDCLVYSIRYYYAQTYMKTIIYYMGVGVTFAYPKIGVGILLFGQLLQFIIFITNPPFMKLRHNMVSGFSYLGTMLHCFCLLIIDLNVVVQNNRAALIFIYIYLALHFLIVALLLMNVFIDFGFKIHMMVKQRNVFDQKNSDNSYKEGELTNVKLNDGDKLSEQTKPRSKDRKKRKSKNKKRKDNAQINSENSLAHSIMTEKERSMLKVNVIEDKQNNIGFDVPPKIRKIKKPRQI